MTGLPVALCQQSLQNTALLLRNVTCSFLEDSISFSTCPHTPGEEQWRRHRGVLAEGLQDSKQSGQPPRDLSQSVESDWILFVPLLLDPSSYSQAAKNKSSPGFFSILALALPEMWRILISLCLERSHWFKSIHDFDATFITVIGSNFSFLHVNQNSTLLFKAILNSSSNEPPRTQSQHTAHLTPSASSHSINQMLHCKMSHSNIQIVYLSFS